MLICLKHQRKTLNDSGLIVYLKPKHINRTNCYEGLSATNANNKYFELSSNNNTGGSLAFVVAEIDFKVTVMTFLKAKISFLGAEIIFKVPVIMSSVAKITFVETKITF